MDIFKILAAVLHLGNVQISSVGDERSSVSVRIHKRPCSFPVAQHKLFSQCFCFLKPKQLHFFIKCSKTVAGLLSRVPSWSKEDSCTKE